MYISELPVWPKLMCDQNLQKKTKLTLKKKQPEEERGSFCLLIMGLY